MVEHDTDKQLTIKTPQFRVHFQKDAKDYHPGYESYTIENT